MLSVGLEDLEGLSGFAVLFSEGTVEGEVNFQDWEVFEILGSAVNREDFFGDGVFPHHLGTLSYTVLIAVLGIDLPKPAGVSVAGPAHLDLGMEMPEKKFLDVCLPIMGHDPSTERAAPYFYITATYQK